MKYKLVKLSKENDLNRELRKQKRERGELSILFVSPWDKYCTALMEKLEKRYKNAPDNAKPLYIVDSYNMPHSFVIFKSSMLPQYVNIKKSKVFTENYLPMIYRTLDIE
tara:strand:+ start:709 stop:1035 length:327 start_codon:yes stop_codon:yes gene_type:complete